LFIYFPYAHPGFFDKELNFEAGPGKFKIFAGGNSRLIMENKNELTEYLIGSFRWVGFKA